MCVNSRMSIAQPVDLNALQPALHPVYARLLCAEMLHRGFSREQILEDTFLDWQQLHQGNAFLNTHQISRLIRHCLRLSQCPWLGFEVGFKTQAAAHGVLGAAMIASENLASGILLLQKYSHLRQHLAVLHIEQDQSFSIVLEERVALGDLREYLLGQLVAGLAQLFTTLTGRDLQPAISIQWPFEKPQWAEVYQRVAIRNSFGHAQLRVSMDADFVLSPSLAADEEALQRNLRECDLLLQRMHEGSDLSHRVRMLLAASEGKMPTLEEMAERLHLTPRTFMRHLAAEQHSYQELLDSVRKDRACWMLQNTDLSVEAVALRLGYEDTSNFSRTFKRWSGQTPRDFKKGAVLKNSI